MKRIIVCCLIVGCSGSETSPELFKYNDAETGGKSENSSTARTVTGGYAKVEYSSTGNATGGQVTTSQATGGNATGGTSYATSSISKATGGQISATGGASQATGGASQATGGRMPGTGGSATGGKATTQATGGSATGGYVGSGGSSTVKTQATGGASQATGGSIGTTGGTAPIIIDSGTTEIPVDSGMMVRDCTDIIKVNCYTTAWQYCLTEPSEYVHVCLSWSVGKKVIFNPDECPEPYNVLVEYDGPVMGTVSVGDRLCSMYSQLGLIGWQLAAKEL